MAELRLDMVGSEYVTGKYTITVKRKPYTGFRLFETITFIEKYGLPFHYFCIKDKDDLVRMEYESRPLKVIDHIEYVDVYVSKYNDKVPLIVRVCNRGQRTYYKWKDLEKNKKYDFRNLKNSFKPKPKLSEDLIPENDLVNKKITYIIDNKVPYFNITVSDHFKKISGYTVYTHKPKDEIKIRDSIVIYTNRLFNIKPNNLLTKKQKDLKRLKTEADNFDMKTFEYLNVYYKDLVTNPLLIEFITLDKKSYYYSIRNKRIWNSVAITDENFNREMEKIEYQLKPSIRFMLDLQSEKYLNKEIKNVKLKNLKIENTIKTIKTKSATSETLHESNYSCTEHYFEQPYEYDHNITESITDPTKFLALSVYVFNVAIDTYNQSDEIEYLLYLPEERLQVYFYNKDKFPLLFRFNKKYYKPNSRKEYFSKWVEVTSLISDPDNSYKIRDELIKINQMLNEININKIVNYGINDEMVEEYFDIDADHVCLDSDCEIKCNNKKMAKKDSEIPIRIKVECQKCDLYNKYIHTTDNKYLIGSITYNSSKILEEVEYIRNSEGVSIEVYYFNFNTEDRTGYPLLIISKTKGKSNHYYLTEKCGINGVNREPTLKPIEMDNIDLNTFLDHQNFFLNNVINININTKKDYQCCYKDLFYCTKQVVKVEASEIGEDSGLECENYLTFKHNLEDKNSKNQQGSTNQKDSLLSKPRLKFTVKNLKLNDTIIKLAHTKEDVKDPLFEMSEAYVHFYNKDPRPLLVYSDGSAFRPKSLKEYGENWILVDDIDYSTRGDGNYKLDPVIQKLHEISYDLNPVDISQSERYYIDTPFHEKISIDVEKKQHLFYKIYIHTASYGHKLGVLKYQNEITVDDSYGTKSKEIDHILVYYYYTDNQNKYPIYIQLNHKSFDTTCYILISQNRLKWKKTRKMNLEPTLNRNRAKREIQYISELPQDTEFMRIKSDIMNEIGFSEHFFYEQNTKSPESLYQVLSFSPVSDEANFTETENTHDTSDKQKSLVITSNSEQSISPSGLRAKPGTSRVVRSEPTSRPITSENSPINNRSTDSSPTNTVTTPGREYDNVGAGHNSQENSHTPLEIPIKELPSTNSYDPYNTVLANGLGGFFGTLFSLSLISILIYKFLSRLRVREMTPSF